MKSSCYTQINTCRAQYRRCPTHLWWAENQGRRVAIYLNLFIKFHSFICQQALGSKFEEYTIYCTNLTYGPCGTVCRAVLCRFIPRTLRDGTSKVDQCQTTSATRVGVAALVVKCPATRIFVWNSIVYPCLCIFVYSFVYHRNLLGICIRFRFLKLV
jgi:hypothetical protein